MDEQLLKSIGEYGVAVFSIGAIIYIVSIFVKFIKNHLEHNTKASQDLANAVKQLLHFLERTRNNK